MTDIFLKPDIARHISPNYHKEHYCDHIDLVFVRYWWESAVNSAIRQGHSNNILHAYLSASICHKPCVIHNNQSRVVNNIWRHAIYESRLDLILRLVPWCSEYNLAQYSVILIEKFGFPQFDKLLSKSRNPQHIEVWNAILGYGCKASDSKYVEYAIQRGATKCVVCDDIRHDKLLNDNWRF